MADLNIDIRKSLVTDETGGDVTIYVSFGKYIGLVEAKRFAAFLVDVIDLAEKWQEGGVGEEKYDQ